MTPDHNYYCMNAVDEDMFTIDVSIDLPKNYECAFFGFLQSQHSFDLESVTESTYLKDTAKIYCS